MDRQTKTCLYSLPSVLATFHWCRSAWGALLCSPISVPGRVVAWEMPGRCAASPCCDLSSQHVLQVRSLFAHFCWRISHSRMNLPVTPCSGHCHLFGRFICSLCFYSYHERSLDQGPWFHYVFVNHLAGWVFRSILGPTESIFISRCACYCYPLQTKPFSHSVLWERYLLVLHGNRIHSSPACVFTRCATAVLPFWCDAVIMFNHLVS